MQLLATRRFLPLFVTQFLGAFNDNVFKNALVMLITFKLAPTLGAAAPLLVTAAAAIFILPYFLFSATAGQLADKYDRARIARATKIWEIVLVLIGAAGFYFQEPYFLLLVLFCLGVQSTFFGPVKYALLPQHLHDGELVLGNAYIEAGTFLAILLGTITGGLVILVEGGELWITLVMLLVAIAGYATSRAIPAAPAPSPALVVDRNILRATRNIVAHDRKQPRVFRAILAISWFWLVGAVFLAQLPTYSKDVLGGDETVVTLLLTLFSVGIGIGSFLGAKILRGKIHLAPVPAAAFSMSIFASTISALYANGVSTEGLQNAWQFIANIDNYRLMAALLGLAISGGIYIVPLYALMQHDSAPESRARTIATNNVINALFMVASAIITMAMLGAGFSVPDLFLATALATVPVALWIRKKLVD
jgi:acyl-[acyl-carrier-protein]-phospholipid O-acyltransferase / long-chain-fatty-acid--[acyl-carrier-protein] ligase